MKKNRWIKGAVAAAVVSALGITACAAKAEPSGAKEVVKTQDEVIKVQNVDERVISVTSKAEVKVVPDMAQIVMAVHTEDADAKLCEDKNAEALENVIELLKGMGIEESSIQTSYYSMNPMYKWTSNERILTGYEMDVTLTVNDIVLEDAGAIISASVEAGANDIQSVSYYSSQYDEKYQEALAIAMQDAQKKADAIAKSGGMSIGKAVHVEEIMPNTQVRYTENAMGAREEAAVMADSAMPVMAGKVSVEANIVVEFETVE